MERQQTHGGTPLNSKLHNQYQAIVYINRETNAKRHTDCAGAEADRCLKSLEALYHKAIEDEVS